MPERSKRSLYVSSLRLERWPRSLAIFSGLVMAYLLEAHDAAISPSTLVKVVVAFFLTWAISTANYIVNEITDAPYDAHHPAKMHRPLVKREINHLVLFAAAMMLALGSLLLAALFFSVHFLCALLLLLLAGILYNVKPMRMKDIPYVDSTLESANNPIRFLIGWYVLCSKFPPLSLLVSWWAFGNFLMVGKRVAEKKFLTEEQSAAYRLSLKRYSLGGLVAFMILNALAFLTAFILFAAKFRLRFLLFGLPFIVFYLLIFIRKSTQDRDAAEEPEKLLKNPYFAFYTLFLIVLFVAAFLLR